MKRFGQSRLLNNLLTYLRGNGVLTFSVKTTHIPRTEQLSNSQGKKQSQIQWNCIINVISLQVEEKGYYVHFYELKSKL